MFYRLDPLYAVSIHLMAMFFSYCLGVYFVRWADLSQGGKSRTLFIEGTLLSLLLGFTFNSAHDRYTSRKRALMEEVSNVSFAHGLTRFYASDDRKRVQRALLGYVGHRIAYHEANGDEVRILGELALSDSCSNVLLDEVAALSRKPENLVVSLQILTTFDKLFDLSVTREELRKTRVPISVMKLLLLISILFSFLHGTNSGFSPSDLMMVAGFCLLIAMTLYLIIDLDLSRSGTISLNAEQLRLKEVYQYLLTHH